MFLNHFTPKHLHTRDHNRAAVSSLFMNLNHLRKFYNYAGVSPLHSKMEILCLSVSFLISKGKGETN